MPLPHGPGLDRWVPPSVNATVALDGKEEIKRSASALACLFCSLVRVPDLPVDGLRKERWLAACWSSEELFRMAGQYFAMSPVIVTEKKAGRRSVVLLSSVDLADHMVKRRKRLRVASLRLSGLVAPIMVAIFLSASALGTRMGEGRSKKKQNFNE